MKLSLSSLILFGAFSINSSTALHAQSSTSGPIKVFLLGGQSNMQGNNAVADQLPPDLQPPQDDVLLYSETNNAAFFGSLQVGAGNHFGPEISFGRAVADAFPNERFCLIKHAEGGTNLHSNWDPAKGPVYSAFRTTVSYGLEALTRTGHSYQIVGMLWTQGESDVGRTTAEYQADLTEFIADVRARYGANLPFFISRLSNNQTWKDISQIRAAQENVAAVDANAHLIDTDGFEMRNDKVHFEETGYVALGRAFAASYLGTRKTTALIPGSKIIATASVYAGKGMAHPYRTVDGSGLSAGVHGNAADTFWNTPAGVNIANQWIQWDLGASYTLDSIHVWNHKDAYINSLKSVDIYFSNAAIPGDPEGNGSTNWTRLGGASVEFPNAPDSNNTGFDLAATASAALPSTKVRYIRFALNSNWGTSARSGLGEIQFTAKPSGRNATAP